MIRSGSRSVAKLRAKSNKRERAGSSRLADMSARIDSNRNASYVRKPVFDQSLEVIAYEIVVGEGPIEAIEPAGDDAGRRLRFNGVLEVDPMEIGGGNPMQLSVTAPAVEAGLPAFVGPSDVMFLLGSGFEPTPAAVASLEGLSAQGFRIVLEDLAGNPHLGGFLRHAYAVKVDAAGADERTISKRVGVLKSANVELIADRIGSYDELRAATKQGFSQFQGSFLSRPDAFRKTRVPTGQLAALELISLLQNSDAGISEIADVIRRDVSLSYRILKVVNSAQYSLPRPLGSIEEAVMLVGTQQIVSWVGAMTLSRMNNKPSELTRVAMIRARACETLAERLARTDMQRFYIVGLFSVIEALLDVPADQALGGLPLAPEILDAVTSCGGIMGEVLAGVIAYEKGDWAHAHVIGLDDGALRSAFHEAVVETDLVWSKIAV